MIEILNYLPLLGIAIFCNILCGTYYNINIKEIKFDLYKLLNGVIKSIIIASVFVGTSYIFDQMKELSEALGITPKFIIISAITLYVGKALIALGKILGVSVEVKKEGK